VRRCALSWHRKTSSWHPQSDYSAPSDPSAARAILCLCQSSRIDSAGIEHAIIELAQLTINQPAAVRLTAKKSGSRRLAAFVTSYFSASSNGGPGTVLRSVAASTGSGGAAHGRGARHQGGQTGGVCITKWTQLRGPDPGQAEGELAASHCTWNWLVCITIALLPHCTLERSRSRVLSQRHTDCLAS